MWMTLAVAGTDTAKHALSQQLKIHFTMIELPGNTDSRTRDKLPHAHTRTTHGCGVYVVTHTAVPAPRLAGPVCARARHRVYSWNRHRFVIAEILERWPGRFRNRAGERPVRRSCVARYVRGLCKRVAYGGTGRRIWTINLGVGYGRGEKKERKKKQKQ